MQHMHAAHETHLSASVPAAAMADILLRVELAKWLDVGSLERRRLAQCMFVAAAMSMATCRKCASAAVGSWLGTCA